LTLVAVVIGRNPQHEEGDEYLVQGAAARHAASRS
jgi:hypothetical protein